MPASAAQFGDDLAKAYGIEWVDDLFAPPGEDGRHTTNVDAFIGHYVDARTSEVQTIPYRMPDPKPASKPGRRGTPVSGAADDDEDNTAPARSRPDVTQKGITMIGDLRTEALHQALADGPIEDDTLLGLLALALGCTNVTVESGSGLTGEDRRVIADILWHRDDGPGAIAEAELPF